MKVGQTGTDGTNQHAVTCPSFHPTKPRAPCANVDDSLLCEEKKIGVASRERETALKEEKKIGFNELLDDNDNMLPLTLSLS
ncbi:uncharacterized [Tachysurus ichikawai]